MKKHGLWVAWIAALALAAMLAASPREGAAAKCMMPDPPVLGDPEQPGSGPNLATHLSVPWLKGARFSFVWVAGSLRAVVIPRLPIERAHYYDINRSKK